MAADALQKDIRYLKGVGETRARLFYKLGVETVGALLRYYPRAHIDFRCPVALADAPEDQPCLVRVTLLSKQPPARTRSGKTVYRLRAADDSAAVNITYFNNRFTPAALEVGKEYLLYGTFGGGLTEKDSINPLPVREDDTKTMRPVYPLTKGLPNYVIANGVKYALDGMGEMPDPLPDEIMRRYGLVSLSRALRDVHFPADAAALDAARRRIAFEEMLALQLGFAVIKARAKAQNGIALADTDCKPFTDSLPFKLTNAQLRCINEICADLSRPVPMNRLLQGDVGSGKTAVAAAGVFCAFKNGLQSAVMAPTEILAAQHANTFERHLSPFGVRVALLTSSVKGKQKQLLLEKIAAGETDLVVGTHALIEGGVTFAHLGFAVADEQHRFGVNQRLRLREKGSAPHMLVMSATPIPRTLSLIIYGELDISVIDEMPAGRIKIKTFLVDKSYRKRYLAFIENRVRADERCYIVCPIIEDSESMEDVESAAEYYNELRAQLNVPCALLHGKMKPAEKTQAMLSFRDGITPVLVCTTVVEVGMDVPDATVMVIENAERFGLSQLHQLRGRVGRSGRESYCILVSDRTGGTSGQRLRAMCGTSDGFQIARLDLEARGPGDFLGSRQHGLPALNLAAMMQDETLLYDAAQAAREICASDPELSQPRNAALLELTQKTFAETGIFN